MGFADEHISYSSTDDNLNTLAKDFILEFEEKSEIAVKTSGSTGTPKHYNVKKERFICSAQRTCDFFQLKTGDQAFLCISPEYIGGKMMLVRSMVRGLDITLGNLSSFPFESKRPYDFAAFVPLQINRIIEKDIDYLKQIKNIIIGGGVLNSKTEQKLVESGINAYVTFGMTETLSHIALRKIGEEEYQVLDGIVISIDDENRLIIQDPKVAEKEVLQTNDIVELLSSHSFKWIGRYDNIINSGGIKLNPETIERKLNKTIHSPFFIAKEADEKLGERLILVIESDKPSESIQFDSLDRFEKPKKVYHVEKFIYTETKKINRTKTLQLIGIEG